MYAYILPDCFYMLVSCSCVILNHFGIFFFAVSSHECDTLFRCAACLRTRVSEGAHLLFLFPRESLERARLKFSLRGGKVTALCLQEGEQVWALNMKRALLSMFQTSRTASKQELVQEVRLDQGRVPSLRNTSL